MDDTLSSNARWHAVVHYRANAGLINLGLYLNEIEDLEGGPLWDTIEDISIRLINHTYSETLTIEQAEDLIHRPARDLEKVGL